MLTAKGFTKPILDCTEELNVIESKEKNLALAILDKYYDVEQVDISDAIEHYPVSTHLTLGDDEEENAALRAHSLERLNNQLWSTVLWNIGGVDLTENRKAGKLKYCTSNKFLHFNKQKPNFKAYCFEIAGELQAEINFTIEFY